MTSNTRYKRGFLFLTAAFVLAGSVFFTTSVLAQSRDDAKRLWEQGEKALKDGKAAEAVRFYERSLSMTRALGDLEGNAGNLSGLGQAFEAMGNDQKAFAFYEESLAVNRRRQNKDGIATNLYNMGVLQYTRFQRNTAALPLLEESLGLFRELNDRESMATVLYWLGRIRNNLGQYDRALSNAQEAAGLSRALNNRQDLAYALNLTGLVCSGLGRYDQALSSFEEALQINRSLNLPLETAVSLRNIGDAYADLVQYDRSLVHYEQALTALRKLDNKEELSIALNNQGLIYRELGEYDKALAAYEESLRVSRELNAPALIAVALNNVGQVQGSLGKLDSALANYGQSLEMERKLNRPSRIATCLNNIGMFYYRLGEGDKALPFLRESLEIHRRANAPAAMAQCLDNMGAVYLAQRNYGAAEAVFLERKGLQARLRGVFLRHAGLVELYLSTGRYGEAIALLQERPPKWNEGSQFRSEYHTQLGRGFKGKGMLREAAHELLTAVTVTEGMRRGTREKSDFFGGGAAIGRLSPHRALVAVLCEMADRGEAMAPEFRPYGKDPATAAWYFTEMTKARMLLDHMAGAAGKYEDRDMPREIRIQEEALVRQLSEVEKAWNEAFRKGGATFERLVARKTALDREMDAFIAMLRQKYPPYAALAYPRPLPLESLPLKNDEVLIAYAAGDEQSRVFVVGKGGIRAVAKIDLPREALEAKVRAYAELLAGRATDGRMFAPGRELYDLLLASALDKIQPNERVTIVPDGILALLPFESLILPGGNAQRPLYVAEQRPFSYAQSATALAMSRMLPAAAPRRPLFALANPIYDAGDPRYAASRRGGVPVRIAARDLKAYAYRGITVRPAMAAPAGKGIGWEEVVYDPLPETEDEVRAIAMLYGVAPAAPDVLLGAFANEKMLGKSDLSDYRYLHFATHADLPGKVQGVLEPFILLGQVDNGPGQDGFLTLSKVLRLRLRADMVVLSACSTGRGRLQEGEGVAGFARAFQYAGAKSVVVSLWEVSSEAAVVFMKSFYGHLKAGKGRAEALGWPAARSAPGTPVPFTGLPSSCTVRAIDHHGQKAFFTRRRSFYRKNPSCCILADNGARMLM